MPQSTRGPNSAKTKVANTCHLTRGATQCLYHAIYNPSVGYALPVTAFTFKELNTIQAKSHSAMLSKMGYNRNSPTEVVFGPRHMGGFGLFHLYDLQGHRQCQLFLKYWRSPHTKTGKHLRIALSWIQYNLGTSKFLLTDTTTDLQHCESCWVNSLRTFLQIVEGTIKVDKDYIPPLQRQNDCYIMDLALASTPALPPCDIKQINYCRLYLSTWSPFQTWSMQQAPT